MTDFSTHLFIFKQYFCAIETTKSSKIINDEQTS